MGANKGRWTIDNAVNFERLQEARKMDLWRRELNYESLDDLLDSLVAVAKLLNRAPTGYILEQFNTWKESNDN